ncbi:MAG TPA: SAM-dependent chlorinase/fluorinase [Gemmatimonadaceae bacterium]|nr:SAM-dependent chlorinase/fluorinase [Gemmatimonadaceae bacterium]
MPALVTLLTDFGTADGYVAELKGVLLSAAPGIQVVDLSHDVPAHDVEAARLVVARYWRRFPAGTIHLVVVDPGVGSAREAIAVSSDGRFLVGPDNGVLSPALLLPGAQVVSLPVPADAAPTFHGRDVFAPAAAALAGGASVESLGRPHDGPVVRRTPEVVRETDGWLRGEVIVIDRFGNAVTNLFGVHDGEVHIGARVIPVRRTYADVAAGEPVALVGSSGLIEVAVRDGSAAIALGLARGTSVRVRDGRTE